jgi:hypothetical protein
MAKLSVESAQEHYANLLAYHRMGNSYATKVPSFKNELENEILPEITGINHFMPKYENNKIVEDGQKKWLLDNQLKMDRYGVTTSGTIPKEIVTGIVNIFSQRNKAEHEKTMTKAAYLGIFDLMARAISCFSDTSIPDEIQAICDDENETTEEDKAVEISTTEASETVKNETQPTQADKPARTQNTEKIETSKSIKSEEERLRKDRLIETKQEQVERLLKKRNEKLELTKEKLEKEKKIVEKEIGIIEDILMKDIKTHITKIVETPKYKDISIEKIVKMLLKTNDE